MVTFNMTTCGACAGDRRTCGGRDEDVGCVRFMSAKTQIRPKFGLEMGRRGHVADTIWVCTARWATFFIRGDPNGHARMKRVARLELL